MLCKGGGWYIHFMCCGREVEGTFMCCGREVEVTFTLCAVVRSWRVIHVLW